MKKFLVLQLLLCLIVPLPARADEPPQADKETELPGDRVELVIAESTAQELHSDPIPALGNLVGPVEPSGPGFLPHGRMMLRTLSVHDGDLDPTGATESWFNTLMVSFGDLRTLHDEFDQFRGSIEFMGQHLWTGLNGSTNSFPEWRLGMQTSSFSLDAGALPFAERSPVGARDAGRNRNWSVVNYFAYGVRADTEASLFRFDGLTDVAGRMYSQTDRDYLLIGPQLAVGQVAQRGRWLFDYSVLALAGYRRVDTQQRNGFGDDALPGGVNNTLFLRPTYSRYEERATSYPIMGELRLITSYFFGSGLSLDVLANAVVEPPTQPTSPVVEYNAPDFGIGGSDSDSGNVLVGNLYLSLTYLR